MTIKKKVKDLVAGDVTRYYTVLEVGSYLDDTTERFFLKVRYNDGGTGTREMTAPDFEIEVIA